MNAQALRVMTYNLRFDNPGDGVNRWSNRKDKVAALIKKYHPDLIGVQEALHHQLKDLVELDPSFAFVGVGRDDGKEKGEFSAILYRKDRFEVKSTETFWLSETPNVPGSKSWDAAITRIVTRVVFYDRSTQKTFTHINTHFDHIGVEARYKSAQIIRELVDKETTEGVVVTGDFNAEPMEKAYPELMRGDLLIDARGSHSEGTFCNFQVGSQPCRLIDYLFHTHFFQTKDYRVIQDHDGVHYPSDHLPVLATLSLNSR